MAPVEMAGALGWFSSTLVCIVSLVLFVILTVALLSLCAQCNRNSADAYDVNMGTMPKAAKAPKGTSGTKKGGADPGMTEDSTWRNYKNMPPSTLERNMRT